MTTTKIYDLLFILVSVAVLLPLTEFGYSHIISRFAVVFMLAAYFTGKYVKHLEWKCKIKSDKPH